MLVRTEVYTREPSRRPYLTNHVYDFETQTEALAALGGLGVVLETFGTDDGGLEIPNYCGRGGTTVFPAEVADFRNAVELRAKSFQWSAPWKVEGPFLEDKHSWLLGDILRAESESFSLQREINQALDRKRALIHSGALGAISELAENVTRGRNLGLVVAQRVLNKSRFAGHKLPESVVDFEYQKDVPAKSGPHPHVVKATVITSKMPGGRVSSLSNLL